MALGGLDEETGLFAVTTQKYHFRHQKTAVERTKKRTSPKRLCQFLTRLGNIAEEVTFPTLMLLWTSLQGRHVTVHVLNVDDNDTIRTVYRVIRPAPTTLFALTSDLQGSRYFLRRRSCVLPITPSEVQISKQNMHLYPINSSSPVQYQGTTYCFWCNSSLHMLSEVKYATSATAFTYVPMSGQWLQMASLQRFVFLWQ